MCILFLHTCAAPCQGKFKVILAVNRDEAYKRPTLPAHFWIDDPSFIGGRDMEPGREGGTWLAMSKEGRIGSLLNVLSSKENSGIQLQGRGNLVPDFLKSSQTPSEYLVDIEQRANVYNPFNLLTIQISDTDISICVCSNGRENPTVSQVKEETIGIGNSLLGQPFCKVSAGTERFKGIVKELGSTGTKEELMKELLTLLRWEERHWPDPEMQKQGSRLPEERLLLLSSVFVKNLPVYGTRTNTLILIDSENWVDYIEWTMKEPINPMEPVWEKIEKRFRLDI